MLPHVAFPSHLVPFFQKLDVSKRPDQPLKI